MKFAILSRYVSLSVSSFSLYSITVRCLYPQLNLYLPAEEPVATDTKASKRERQREREREGEREREERERGEREERIILLKKLSPRSHYGDSRIETCTSLFSVPLLLMLFG
jgi:hypothetical protein